MRIAYGAYDFNIAIYIFTKLYNDLATKTSANRLYHIIMYIVHMIIIVESFICC